MQLVAAGAVEDRAIHQGGMAADNFAEAVGALVHAGDAVGQSALEFQVDGAQQERQLFVVRIVAGVADALLNDFKVLAVDGLKRIVFHGRVRRADVRLIPFAMGRGAGIKFSLPKAELFSSLHLRPGRIRKIRETGLPGATGRSWEFLAVRCHKDASPAGLGKN